MATTTRKTPIKYRRGKPMPLLRHNDFVDWTTFPLNSKPNGRRIEVCPTCGRKGEASHYRSGGAAYTHLSQFTTVFWMVKESCQVGQIG